MKLKTTIISDTHKLHDYVRLPGGDLLIHCGDACGIGNLIEFEDFIEWFCDQDYTHKIFIAGNHDCCLDSTKPLWFDKEYIEKILNNDFTYLENSFIVIEGLKIWGSPVTPNFYEKRWAFNKARGEEIKEVWDSIPSDTDILVTHGPARNYLDFSPYGNLNVGCEDLRNKILEVGPMIHCFGHIHSSYGNYFNGKTEFINASICDEQYKPTNLPINLIIDTELKSFSYGF